MTKYYKTPTHPDIPAGALRWPADLLTGILIGQEPPEGYPAKWVVSVQNPLGRAAVEVIEYAKWYVDDGKMLPEYSVCRWGTELIKEVEYRLLEPGKWEVGRELPWSVYLYAIEKVSAHVMRYKVAQKMAAEVMVEFEEHPNYEQGKVEAIRSVFDELKRNYVVEEGELVHTTNKEAPERDKKIIFEVARREALWEMGEDDEDEKWCRE